MSCFGHWWGGYSFGPRFSTGLVPWFVVIDNSRRTGETVCAGPSELRVRASGKALELSVGALLLFVSIAINALGAADRNTSLWNVQPQNIDSHPDRNWDWRQPQFLAGFLHPPFPNVVPLLQQPQLMRRNRESELFFWYGWSIGRTPISLDRRVRCALVFAMAHPVDTQLTMRVVGFIVPGRPRQRVTVALNATPVGKFEIADNLAREYELQLPATVLRDQNVLTFTLPDAASPQSLRLGNDPRKLGLAMYWLRFTARYPRHQWPRPTKWNCLAGGAILVVSRLWLCPQDIRKQSRHRRPDDRSRSG